MAVAAVVLGLALLPGAENPAPQLVCRWHTDSTGRLLCSWHRDEARSSSDQAPPTRPRKGLRLVGA